jgi:hypothetical protein
MCLLLLSCKSVKPINGFGEEDKVCRKYDVVNDITYVRDLSNFNDLRIKGKWKDSNRNLDEYCTFWKNKNINYTIIKSDIKASYYIYEVIEYDKRRIELMGINNKKYYRIAIYNFDPNQYTSIEDFLIGIFATN